MRFSPKKLSLRALLLGTAYLFLCFCPLLVAGAPPWWESRGVVIPGGTANDYAAVNQGQAKFMALQACEELEAELPGGAGAELNALRQTLLDSANSSANFQPINAGQLKNLAKPFYDRLIAVGYTNAYPWAGAAHADDYAIVNIGQVKNLFSFDVTLDSENGGLGDGLPDWWEHAKFGNLDQTPEDDPDGDLLTNLEEFEGESDPGDYFEDKTITITATLDQYVSYQSLQGSRVRLVVRVWRENGATKNLMTNAPLKIEVLDSDGGFCFNEFGSTPLYSTLTGKTNDAGELLIFHENPSAESLFFQQPSQGNVTTHIRIQALGRTVVAELTLEAKSLAPTPYQISATRLEDGSNYVSWVSQENSEDIDIQGYVLERTSDGENWEEVTEVDIFTVNYTDGDLEENKTYHYRLSPFYDVGEGGRLVGTPVFTSPNEFQHDADSDGDGFLNSAEASRGSNAAQPDPSGTQPEPEEETGEDVPPASYALIRLPKPPGEEYVFAGETNSSGTTSGISYRYNGDGETTSAVLLRWTQGQVENLGTMATIPFSKNELPEPDHYYVLRSGGVFFTKINDVGSILCYGYLWKNGVFKPLAEQDEISIPYDLNNSDQIVGVTLPLNTLVATGSFIVTNGYDQLLNTDPNSSVGPMIESINDGGKTFSPLGYLTTYNRRGYVDEISYSVLKNSDELLAYYNKGPNFYYPKIIHLAKGGYSEYLPLPKNFRPSSSYQKCLNSLGNAVISYSTNGGQKTALWMKGKPREGYSVLDLSHLIPGRFSFYPTDINDQNVITGNLFTSQSEYVPVMLLPIDISFEKVGDNWDIEDNKDADGNWMPGKGKRIFVDAKTPTEIVMRDSVYVKVKNLPPGWKVRLKSFDVDDPTPESQDPYPYVIDDNDTQTVKKGGDNRAYSVLGPVTPFFETNLDITVDCTVDAEGVARLSNGELPKLIMTDYAGDNVRVAVIFLKPNGTLMEGQDLSMLQVTDSTQPGYVPGDSDKQASGFSGGLSPVLTVWRKLNIEVDSMETVTTTGSQKNFEAGVVQAVVNGPFPGQSTVTVDILLTGPENRYEDGRLIVSGTSYPIFTNTDASTNFVTGDQIVVFGSVPSSAIGQAFTIFDDDDNYLTGLGFSSALPKNALHATIVNKIRTKYTPAYIQVEDANAKGWNPHQTINFELNSWTNGLGRPALTASKDLNGSSEFWCRTVVMAYQPEVIWDCDPVTEDRRLGTTPYVPGINTNYGYSAIFIETIRDVVSFPLTVLPNISAAKYGEIRIEFDKTLYGVIAHEVAHVTKNETDTVDHDEGGIMQTPYIDQNFSPKSIKRFRESTNW